jgi:ADP-ribose pyrophosphatase YjhB (NUDIX family)
MDESTFTPEQKLKQDLRHYPVRPHVGVGGVIYWKDNVLLIKRKFNPDARKWAIPGGHLKLGEPTAEGALRECEEETGLKLKIRSQTEIIDRIDRDATGKIEYHYILIDYIMDLVGNYSEENPPIPIAQSDVSEARFVRFSDLPSYNLTYSVVELFKRLHLL